MDTKADLDGCWAVYDAAFKIMGEWYDELKAKGLLYLEVDGRFVFKDNALVYHPERQAIRDLEKDLDKLMDEARVAAKAECQRAHKARMARLAAA